MGFDRFIAPIHGQQETWRCRSYAGEASCQKVVLFSYSRIDSICYYRNTMLKFHFTGTYEVPQCKKAVPAPLRHRTVEMDKFVSTIHNSSRYDVENVAVSVRQALAAARSRKSAGAT